MKKPRFRVISSTYVNNPLPPRVQKVKDFLDSLPFGDLYPGTDLAEAVGTPIGTIHGPRSRGNGIESEARRYSASPTMFPAISMRNFAGRTNSLSRFKRQRPASSWETHSRDLRHTSRSSPFSRSTRIIMAVSYKSRNSNNAPRII